MTSQRPHSLADYARAARRRKLILFLPVVVLALATTAALRELPSLFESTARLRVTNTKGNAFDLSVQLSEFRKQLAARDTLEAVLNDIKPGAVSGEAVVSQIRERITVEQDTDLEAQPGAFRVACRAADPDTARRLTDALANRLTTQSSNQSSPERSEAAVLRKRAADFSIQLHELEAKDPWSASLRSDAGVVASAQPSRSPQVSPDAIRAQQMTIEGLRDQQYKVQQQLADVDHRIATQRQIVDQQTKGSTLRDNPTYAVLIAKRTELQGQRDTLINRQELTDKHPRVLAITDQIAAINRQVEELRQQDSALVRQSPEARELAALESERNRLRVDLEVAGRELVRRSASPPVVAAAPESTPTRRTAFASRQVEHYLDLKRSYDEATGDLQNAEARLQRADGSAPAQLSLLEPASSPERPVSPNRPLLISIAGALGLALGAIAALFAESRRFKSLQCARDVEHHTRLPLLASIPRTATASERRRARWLSAARLVFATASSAVATVGLAKIFIAADVLALIVKK